MISGAIDGKKIFSKRRRADVGASATELASLAAVGRNEERAEKRR
jgi:hypothetical protein